MRPSWIIVVEVRLGGVVRRTHLGVMLPGEAFKSRVESSSQRSGVRRVLRPLVLPASAMPSSGRSCAARWCAV
jgi:hypothetical protein